MNYTLRQLDIFLAVARHENVSRAGDELALSQSAASSALQTLEQAYGMQLFERRGNRLSLSSVGRSLRNEAEALLAHARQFEQALQQHGELGHLRVGASFTIGHYLAAQYLAKYLQQFPAAEVDLHSENTPGIVERLLNYELDIGMIEREVQHRDLELIPWRDDELTVFCAATHPYAKLKSLGNKELRNAEWILREANSGARQSFEHALKPLLPELNIIREFAHNEAVKSAVEAGLGIGCLSQQVIRNDLASGKLIALPLQRKRIQRRFYFALPRRRHHKQAVDQWMSICRD